MPPTATAEAVPAVKPAAVPVKFVAVMLEGVPPAPLNVTNAPADPTFTPSAGATPVPKEVMPVPPLATGSAEPSVKEGTYDVAATMSVPLHTSKTLAPFGTDTPVCPETLTVTACPPVVLL